MKQGKVNIKTIIIVVIILLVGVLAVVLVKSVTTLYSGATAGADPKTMLATPGDDGRSATITWTTDKAVQSVVEYGATPASLLLRAPEADATTNHQVVLSPLKSGQTYYFRIRVGDDVYDNNGINFSFKTKMADDTAVGTGTTAPLMTPTPLVPIVPAVSVAPVGSNPASPSTGSSASKCQPGVDYNKDGVINSVDFINCLKTGPGTAATSSPSSPAVSPTAAATSSCTGGVDYDNNGIINSLDMIKCLQTKK